MNKLRELAGLIAGWTMVSIYVALFGYLICKAWTYKGAGALLLPEAAVNVATLGSGLVAAVVATLLGQPTPPGTKWIEAFRALKDHRAILWVAYLLAYLAAGIGCAVTWILCSQKSFALPDFYKANALVFVGLMVAVARSFLIPPKPPEP